MLARVASRARAKARALGPFVRRARRSPRAAAGAGLVALAAVWALAAVPEAEHVAVVVEPAPEAAPALERQRHDVYLGFANLPPASPRRRLDADEPVRQLRALALPQRPDASAPLAEPAPAPAAIPLVTATDPQPGPAPRARRDPPPAWIPPGEFLESPLAAAADPAPRIRVSVAGAPTPAASETSETPVAAAEPIAKPALVAALPARPVTLVPPAATAAPSAKPSPVVAAKPSPVVAAEPRPVVVAEPKPAPVAIAEPIRPVTPAAPSAAAVAPPAHRAEPAAPAPAVRPEPVVAPGLDIVLGRNDAAARPTPPPVALPAQPTSPIGGSVVAAIGDLLAIGQHPAGQPGLAAHGMAAPARPIEPFLLFAVGEDPILVPEPGSLLLLGGGLLALGLSARRR